jgi:hypothetical protein
VDYVLGLAKNERLIAEIDGELYEAWEYLQETGQPARVFRDFEYQTLDSWSRTRRVIGKAEQLPAGRNPRFIVTSLTKSEVDGRSLYEDVYCARGDMENRIKEQQLGLFADRTSAETMRANQLRLWISRRGVRAHFGPAPIGSGGDGLGRRAMRHDSPQAVENRRSSASDGAQSMAVTVGGVSLSSHLRGCVPDSAKRACRTRRLNQHPDASNDLKSIEPRSTLRAGATEPILFTACVNLA